MDAMRKGLDDIASERKPVTMALWVVVAVNIRANVYRNLSSTVQLCIESKMHLVNVNLFQGLRCHSLCSKSGVPDTGLRYSGVRNTEFVRCEVHRTRKPLLHA